MRYQIGQLSVGQILDHSFRLLAEKWRLFLGVGGLLYAPILVLQAVLTMMFSYKPQPGASPEEMMAATMDSSGIILVISLITSALYLLISGPLLGASVTYAVSKEYLGQEVTIGESLRVAVSKLVAVLWTGLLSGILIILGFVCFIIPGILLAFRYYLAQQIVVLEHDKGYSALKRSGQLMKGSYGIAFVLGFVISICSGLVAGAASIIPIPVVSQILAIIVQTAMAVLWSIAAVVLYFHCRSKVENYDLQLLAESVGDDEAESSVAPPPLPTAQ